MLPMGTHDYARFIRPAELGRWTRAAGLDITHMTGLTYNPLTGVYRLDPTTSTSTTWSPRYGPNERPARTRRGPVRSRRNPGGYRRRTSPTRSTAPWNTSASRPCPTTGSVPTCRTAPWRWSGSASGWDPSSPDSSRDASSCSRCTRRTCAATPSCSREWRPPCSQLERDGIPWGIVTNKPAWLTDPLVDAHGTGFGAPAALVSGDTLRAAQTAPGTDTPRLQRWSESRRPRTWYVGDAGRDMQAGRAAGCNTIAAEYGYIHPDDPPDTWDSDLVVERPEQLGELLLQHAATD
jgi:hypothetical protein